MLPGVYFMYRTRFFTKMRRGGQSAVEYCWSGSTTNYYNSYLREYTQEYERMIDEDGGRTYVVVDGKRSLRYKECYHHRFVATADLKPVVLKTSNSPLVYCSLDKYRLLSQALTGGVEANGFDAAISIAEEIHRLVPSYLSGHYERWVSSKPTMASRANLFQFLVELRDVKRMFQILPSRHLRYKNTYKKLSGWKEALRYGNGQHLNYNFGFKPFVRDVVETFRAVDSFEVRLANFLEKENQLIKRRRGSATSELKGTLYPNRLGAYCQAEIEYEIFPAHVSAFQYTYQIPLKGSGLRWAAYADTLGLNVTPGNIWRVLPWTFVVDWFYDVGKMLDSTTHTDWSQPYVTLYQAMSQVGADWTARAFLRSSGPGGERFSVMLLNGRAFVRKPAVPEASGMQGELDADKIRLLASLGASRIL